MFKGQMVKALKEKRTKTGDKNGATVKLEHLKTVEVMKLYTKYCK